MSKLTDAINNLGFGESVSVKINISQYVDKINESLEAHLTEDDITDIIENNSKDLKYDVMEIIEAEKRKDV